MNLVEQYPPVEPEKPKKKYSTLFAVVFFICFVLILNILIYVWQDNFFKSPQENSSLFDEGVEYGTFQLINRTTTTGNIVFFSDGKLIEKNILDICENLNTEKEVQTNGTTK